MMNHGCIMQFSPLSRILQTNANSKAILIEKSKIGYMFAVAQVRESKRADQAFESSSKECTTFLFIVKRLDTVSAPDRPKKEFNALSH